jgi:hypothetical protein
MTSLRGKGRSAKDSVSEGYEIRDVIRWLSAERSEGLREEAGIPGGAQQQPGVRAVIVVEAG